MNKFVDYIFILVPFYFKLQFWQKSWKKFSYRFLEVIGFCWLVISLLDYTFPDSNYIPHNSSTFWYVCVIAVFLSIITTRPLTKISRKIKDKDISITIIVGDIFKQKSDIVIATNTTFDTTTKGDFISPKSVQGQLANNEYDKIENLDSEMEIQLNNTQIKKSLCRNNSKCNQYPIGTTIKLLHEKSKFKSYWVAIADVNEHGKPKGEFYNLQIGLGSLWDFISTNGHMTQLAMPILGSGRSSINVPRFKILQEIIFSFVAFSREVKITEDLIICIQPSDINDGKVDMYEIQKYLEYECKYKNRTTNSLSSSTGI